MHRLPHLLIFFFVLSSCTPKPGSNVSENNPPDIKTKRITKLDNTEVAQELLTLKSTLDSASVDAKVEENLFGEFYCDRVAFYVIENPLNKMYSSATQSIVLYYLDGELRKSKYILAEDIEGKLIQQLGNFKIMGLDFKNREVIISKPVVIKSEDGISLNDALDNYRLKWTIGNFQVIYIADKKKDEYIYIEKVKEYEQEFREIERYCI